MFEKFEYQISDSEFRPLYALVGEEEEGVYRRKGHA